MEREGGREESKGPRKSYVDSFVGKAWRNSRGLFLGFGEEDGEVFDGGHGDVAPIVSGEEGLATTRQSASRLPVYTKKASRVQVPCPLDLGRRARTPWLEGVGRERGRWWWGARGSERRE